MKIVLFKELEKLGRVGEVKEVSDGYARNYLFPQKIAKEATEKNIEMAGCIKKKKKQKKESSRTRKEKKTGKGRKAKK